jgi:hypothetical protein
MEGMHVFVHPYPAYRDRILTDFAPAAFGAPLAVNEKKLQKIEATALQPLLASKPLTRVCLWGPHCPPCVAKVRVYDSLSSVYESRATAPVGLSQLRVSLPLFRHFIKNTLFIIESVCLKNTLHKK